ncbi:MAG: STAS/SEC14 domain-containing protein [Pirellulales bacterium]|nr:STAS/SEC14 domain-containing protein [Pirellulales bacterium]
MSVELYKENDGKVLNVRVSGKLTKEDYALFVPEFEKSIIDHGKIRILFEMNDFHGWEAAALWEDLKLDFKHWADIERIAMVGDKAWQEGMSFFCKPFTTAKVRYFGHHELDRARQWISEGILAATEQSQTKID